MTTAAARGEAAEARPAGPDPDPRYRTLALQSRCAAVNALGAEEIRSPEPTRALGIAIPGNCTDGMSQIVDHTGNVPAEAGVIT